MRSATGILLLVTLFLVGCGSSKQQASAPTDTVPAFGTADVKALGFPPNK